MKPAINPTQMRIKYENIEIAHDQSINKGGNWHTHAWAYEAIIMAEKEETRFFLFCSFLFLNRKENNLRYF